VAPISLLYHPKYDQSQVYKLILSKKKKLLLLNKQLKKKNLVLQTSPESGLMCASVCFLQCFSIGTSVCPSNGFL